MIEFHVLDCTNARAFSARATVCRANNARFILEEEAAVNNVTLSGLMRRTNSNLFVLVVILVAAVVLMSGGLRKYLGSLLQGARPANNAVLTKITSADDLEGDYFTVQGDKNFDTGYEAYTQKDGSSTKNYTAEFRLLRMNDHYLIVKTPTRSDKRLKFTGLLESPAGEVFDGVSEDLKKADPNAKLYPFILHAGNSPSIWLALIFGALVLIMLWYVSQWARRTMSVQNHPLVARLKPYGDFAAVEASVNQDLATKDAVRSGNTRIMDNWLLRTNRFSLNLIPLSDIAWAYSKVTQHRTNGIPTGKTFSAVINSQNQPELEIVLKKKQAEPFLEALHERAPWAVYGFTEDLKASWQKDRNGFLGHVEGRKAQIMGGSTVGET
jgi:hypothetical protein